MPKRRAPHGARGLKYSPQASEGVVCRRAPHGARGLKYRLPEACYLRVASRPARGAWIEICISVGRVGDSVGRAPHGARGLKFFQCHPMELKRLCRAPHGARGLKWRYSAGLHPDRLSRPARGAWIEMLGHHAGNGGDPCRAPHGARGLKYEHC